MSKTSTWILIIVIIVLVGLGIWWWSMSQYQNNPSAPGYGDNSANGTSTASALPSGNSDQAIDQEMTDANVQMNGLSSDSASINQGLDDQPVQQTQP